MDLKKTLMHDLYDRLAALVAEDVTVNGVFYNWTDGVIIGYYEDSAAQSHTKPELFVFTKKGLDKHEKNISVNIDPDRLALILVQTQGKFKSRQEQAEEIIKLLKQ